MICLEELGVKAIPTKLNGVVFRSRLEARWSVYLNLMGLEWEYEREGYTDGVNSYLPDFDISVPNRIDDCNTESFFVEIKPERSLTKKEIDKIHVATKIKDVLVLFGYPSSRSGKLFTKDSGEKFFDVVLKSPFGDMGNGCFFYEKGHNPEYHFIEEDLALEAMNFDLVYNKPFKL